MKNKILIFAVILTSALSLNAYANSLDLESRVLRKSDRINRLLNRRAHTLSRTELKNVLHYLKAIGQIVRDDDAGDMPNANMSALRLISEGAFNLSTSEDSSKAANGGILNSNISKLENIKRACDPTRTWTDNKVCLITSFENLMNRPNQHEYLVNESVAKRILIGMCTQTKTWINESNCFSRAVSQANYNIQDLVIGCSNLSNSESKSRCFRAALN